MSGFDVFLLLLFGAGFLFLFFRKADKKSIPSPGTPGGGGGGEDEPDDDKGNGDD